MLGWVLTINKKYKFNHNALKLTFPEGLSCNNSTLFTRCFRGPQEKYSRSGHDYLYLPKCVWSHETEDI